MQSVHVHMQYCECHLHQRPQGAQIRHIKAPNGGVSITFRVQSLFFAIRPTQHCDDHPQVRPVPRPAVYSRVAFPTCFRTGRCCKRTAAHWIH